jgi:hypothetical protein
LRESGAPLGLGSCTSTGANPCEGGTPGILAARPWVYGRRMDVCRRRAERFVVGTGAKVEELEGDPHALLARLREPELVSWLPALEGVACDTARYCAPGDARREDVHRRGPALLHWSGRGPEHAYARRCRAPPPPRPVRPPVAPDAWRLSPRSNGCCAACPHSASTRPARPRRGTRLPQAARAARPLDLSDRPSPAHHAGVSTALIAAAQVDSSLRL